MKLGRDLTLRRIRSKGIGIFIEREFKKGELVVRGRPVSKTKVRTDYSFQIGFNSHVELDEPARLINHSCDPNLGIRNNNLGGYDFVAIKQIKPGEELGWDYCTTEYSSLVMKGSCLCGSKNCRSKIGGYITLSQEQRERYREFIADYLKK